MIGLLVLPFLLAQQPTVLLPGWSVTARVISRIRKLSLLQPHALRFWLQLWLRLTCKTKPGLVLLLQSLKSSSLACVQTSPLPQENIGRGDVIFPEGGGTSVHRRLKLAFVFRKTTAEAFFLWKKCEQNWRVLASQFRSSDQQSSPVKKAAAKRWSKDKKLSLLLLLSTSTSDSVHSSPRGTRHILLFWLAAVTTDWNFRDQAACDCCVSVCEASQACSSGVGSGGNSFLSSIPSVRKAFSFFDSCCKLPRSRTVVVINDDDDDDDNGDAVAILKPPKPQAAQAHVTIRESVSRHRRPWEPGMRSKILRSAKAKDHYILPFPL